MTVQLRAVARAKCLGANPIFFGGGRNEIKLTCCSIKKISLWALPPAPLWLGVWSNYEKIAIAKKNQRVNAIF